MSDLLSRSRGYIRHLHWFVRGCDDEDLLGIFVLAGLEAAQRGNTPLFFLAGRRALMDAMRARGRMCRSGIEVPLEEGNPRAEDDYEQADARMTVELLMEKASLTPLEASSIEAFLRGERTLYETDGNREGKRLGNAACKAVKKMRESTG